MACWSILLVSNCNISCSFIALSASSFSLAFSASSNILSVVFNQATLDASCNTFSGTIDCIFCNSASNAQLLSPFAIVSFISRNLCASFHCVSVSNSCIFLFISISSSFAFFILSIILSNSCLAFSAHFFTALNSQVLKSSFCFFSSSAFFFSSSSFLLDHHLLEEPPQAHQLHHKSIALFALSFAFFFSIATFLCTSNSFAYICW